MEESLLRLAIETGEGYTSLILTDQILEDDITLKKKI